MRKLRKPIALVLILTMLTEMLSPSISYALTSGPSQPEMTGFTPVSVTDMVNTFTGDFTYNIPLMDVGGYPLNISYQSGITMDQEASWVGLGWTLNPGSINRQLRGLPDDFKGDQVKKSFNIKEDKTLGLTIGATFEFAGIKIPKKLGVNLSIFRNSYKGFGLGFGLSPSVSAGKSGTTKFTAGLGLDFNSQEGSSVSASVGFEAKEKNDNFSSGGSLSSGINSRAGLKALSFDFQRNHILDKTVLVKDKDNPGYEQSMRVDDPVDYTSSHSHMTFGTSTFTPYTSMPMVTSSFSYGVSTGAELFPSNPNLRLTGYGSVTKLKDKQINSPGFGYLYNLTGKTQPAGLLDFNRAQDGAYVDERPALAVPANTFDLFSIGGQGVGGQFRAYSNSPQVLFDPYSSISSVPHSLGVHIGGGNAFKGGVDIDASLVTTSSGVWSSRNKMLAELKKIGLGPTSEYVYFKSVGEKGQSDPDYYNSKLGDNNALRPVIKSYNELSSDLTLFTSAQGNTINSEVDQNFAKQVREPRRKTIAYLNAGDAQYAALDKQIPVYSINECHLNSTSSDLGVNYESRLTDSHKKHHISEICVTEENGKRYMYGIPAYNNVQKEVTFSAGTSITTEQSNGLCGYWETQRSTDNSSGKDGYYNCIETPAYSHSFLLTGVLSPDYMDLTGNGISTDDPGDAVKINYSKVFPNYKWRSPVTVQNRYGNFNLGMRSDDSDETSDNKVSYLYGEKEIWYVHSIESKTMLAMFILENRIDGLQSKSEDGEIDDTQFMKSLKEIRLFSKSDLVKYGSNAVPIKTVHFEYDYSQCKNVPNNINYVANSSVPPNNSGKLTLRKIYFTYGKNDLGALNPYIFEYADSTKFTYAYRNYDRWGVYNLGVTARSLTPSTFPYTLQDKALVDEWSSAWHLKGIVTPSGSHINIGYESKDYAFVQDKRAGQMFFINKTDDGTAPNNRLYNGNTMYNKLYIEVTEPVSSKDDIFKKYLYDCKKTLYFNCLVNLGGGKQEYINGFAEIEDWDIVSGNPNLIMLQLKEVDAKKRFNANPIAKATWDFVRMNIPHIAYGGPPVANDMGDAILQLVNVMGDMVNIVRGIDGDMRDREVGETIDLQKSWVRLSNPNMKKLGGGCRVKQITYDDNWNHITNGNTMTYGTVYDYTMEVKEGNDIKIISSGVAAWEPEIGADENPFKLPVKYSHSNPLAPSNNFFVMEPLSEAFYPSAQIGYRKVSVRPIVSNTTNYRTAPGYSVYEYNTAYDYPVIAWNTYKDNSKKHTFKMPGVGIIPKFTYDLKTASQGFLVELNDMHGKQKCITDYNSEGGVVQKTSYKYKEVVDANTGVRRIDNNADVVNEEGKVIAGEVGKEVDAWMDFRESDSKIGGINVNINTESFILPIFVPLFILFPPIIPKFQKEHTRLRTAVAVKVVNRFALVDEVIVEKNGGEVRTQNLAYDAVTGDVVLTKTTNEFNDPLYSFNYPAFWAYKNMGGAFTTSGVWLSDKIITNGVISSTNMLSIFAEGDELLIKHLNSDGLTVSNQRAWISFNGADMKVIDDKGNLITTSTNMTADILVVRSGRRNLLMQQSGGIISNTNPIKGSSNNRYIDIVNGDDILGLNAMEYNDTWKINCQRVPYINDFGPYCPTTDEGSCIISMLNNVIHADNCNNTFDASSNSPFPISSLGIGNDCVLGSQSFNNFGFYPGVSGKTQTLDAQWHLVFGSKHYCINIFSVNHNNNNPVEIVCGQDSLHFEIDKCEITLRNGLDTIYGVVEIRENCDGVQSCINQILPGDIVNPYLLGIKNRWLPVREYAYNGSRDAVQYNLAGPLSSIRTAGKISDNNIKFWNNSNGTTRPVKNTNLSDKWIEKSSTTIVNRRSESLESKDALDIYSSALYGYEEYYPVAVAGNSKYREIANDNFEDYDYSLNPMAPCWMDHFSFRTTLISPVSTISNQAHTGLHSFKLMANNEVTVLRDLVEPGNGSILTPFTGQWKLNEACLEKFSPQPGKNYLVSLWVKDEGTCSGFSNSSGYIDISYEGSIVTHEFHPSGPVIEGWQRIEGTFIIPLGVTEIKVKLKSGTDVTASYFDDFRLSPANGAIKTYVYNPINLRLMAELDNNNYATLYEYDDEGKLIRLKKETERGIMTLKESRTVLHKN